MVRSADFSFWPAFNLLNPNIGLSGSQLLKDGFMFIIRENCKRMLARLKQSKQDCKRKDDITAFRGL